MHINWMEAALLFGALLLAIWIGVPLWNKYVGTSNPSLAV